MSEVINLIQQHGEIFYLITFIWTALEGESFVIFAAFAAQRGMLNIWLLFTAAWFGSFFGDQVYFFIGRYFGNWILKRFPRIEPRLRKVFCWVEYNSTIFILTYRFMYGIRNISSVALGMSRLPWPRFLWLNFIAAGLWAASFCGFGYFFSDIMGRYRRPHEQEVEHGIAYELTISVIVMIIVIMAIKWAGNRLKSKVMSRRQRMRSARAQACCCDNMTGKSDAQKTSQE